MKELKTIQGTLSGHLALGLHADLQMRLYAAISPIAPAKMLLEAADIAACKADIDTESDVAGSNMRSTETALMAKKEPDPDHSITSPL